MKLKSMFIDEAMYSPRAQLVNQIVALGLIVLFVTALNIKVGMPPTLIVGASAIIGFFCWRAANFSHPIDPVKSRTRDEKYFQTLMPASGVQP